MHPVIKMDIIITAKCDTSPKMPLAAVRKLRPLTRSKIAKEHPSHNRHIHSFSLIIFIFLTCTTLSPIAETFQLPPSHKQQELLEDRCLACIRSVTSVGIDPSKRCEGGYFCGPYQFSYQYWAEAGKPGDAQGIRNFEKCARDKQCAEQTVKAYYKKFKRDCNNDGLIDCLDMGALHKAGPNSCSQDWFYKSRYWNAFNKTVCATVRPSDAALQLDKGDLDGQQQAPQQMASPIKNQTLTSECLDCICEALSSCSPASTNNCGSGLVCGPFAISQAYWKDGRRPGASWTACARTKECSSVAIRNYMDKYKRDCNGDGFITCEDYAAIHRRGPMSCTNRDLLKEQYWTRFLTCRANQRPMRDANLVKVDESKPESPLGTLTSRGDGPIMSSSESSANSIATQSSAPFAQTTTAMITPKVSLPQSPTTSRQTTISSFTFELNPVVFETKASGNLMRTYTQPTRPAVQQVHDLVVSQQTQYQSSSPTSIELTPAPTRQQPATLTSAPSQASFEANEYYPAISTQTNYQEAPRRPLIDYSSLPTIIVAKPLGAQSTNRISQPPPLASSMEAPVTTLSMPTSMHETIKPKASTTTSTTITTTTTPPSQQPTTISYTGSSLYSEMTTLYSTSPSGAEPVSQQHANAQAPLADQLIDGIDYAMPDFSGGGTSVDRISFDRVVNGIVANPDFSRSYPPIPEIITMQRKQPIGPQSSSSSSVRGPQRDSQSSRTTSHSPIPSTSDTPSSSTISNKRENSKTLSPNIYNSPDINAQASRPIEDVVDQLASSIGTPVGPNAVNMKSLFEKGLNESSRVASECLDCICDASSNCDATVQCISKQREKNRCGLYMISWNQYKESDISLTTLLSATSSAQQNDEYDEKFYYECTTDKNCAEKLIHLYIEKYQKDCNGDGKIDCYDIAAIHRVGPDSCNSGKFIGSQYWRDFNHCYATDRQTTTIQPSAQSSQSGQ